ncbi:MAG: D-glycero-beta-D-manno-heptose 1-phosphate adenylyltransferase [Bacillota bacterium]|nr:D-glycero-beta-D-manno-heptose 1-phosphate adenylyltransferase [Bacillota bacterium]
MAEARRQGKRLVFTNGCFDLLHSGHVRYLAGARALGDLLAVGLNSDASVRRLKGPLRPFVPQQERAEVLAALASVDYVVLFEEASPARLIAALRPEVYAKGGDYARRALPERPLVEAYGGQVVLLPEAEGRSTTALAERVAARLGGERARERFLAAWRRQRGEFARMAGSRPEVEAGPAARALLAEESELFRVLGREGGAQEPAGLAPAGGETSGTGIEALLAALRAWDERLEAALERLPAGAWLAGGGGADGGPGGEAGAAVRLRRTDLAGRLEALLLRRERLLGLLEAAGGRRPATPPGSGDARSARPSPGPSR